MPELGLGEASGADEVKDSRTWGSTGAVSGQDGQEPLGKPGAVRAAGAWDGSVR